MSASKKKGTAGETELLAELLELLPHLRRTPPGSKWDLEHQGDEGAVVFDILATRPDRGRWLVTMSLDSFRDLVGDLGSTGAGEFRIESAPGNGTRLFVRVPLSAYEEPVVERKIQSANMDGPLG